MAGTHTLSTWLIRPRSHGYCAVEYSQPALDDWALWKGAKWDRTFYLTRGQPPLLAMSIEKYLGMKKDDDVVAMLAYPLLERSYTGYWNGPAHATPIRLSTCRDEGGKDLRPELASECEAGLDFTPIFGGEISNCVPIHVNCALVRQAQVLAGFADRFGWSDKAAHWRNEADTRAHRINQYCWDDGEGCYFEYDYVRKTRSCLYYSLNAYWPLWTGIASPAQAKRVANHLDLFDHPYGLTFTDKTYPGIHPEYKALEWAYPESWPQQQIVVGQALQRYGSRNRLGDKSALHCQCGYNMGKNRTHSGGTLRRRCRRPQRPVERDPAQPLHGFSSASAVVVGRIAFT